jgi:hypothetical protein
MPKILTTIALTVLLGTTCSQKQIESPPASAPVAQAPVPETKTTAVEAAPAPEPLATLTDVNVAANDIGGGIEELTGNYGPGFTGRRLIDGLLDPTWQLGRLVTFDPVEARFVKLRVLSGAKDSLEIAEIRVLEALRRDYVPLIARAFWSSACARRTLWPLLRAEDPDMAPTRCDREPIRSVSVDPSPARPRARPDRTQLLEGH